MSNDIKTKSPVKSWLETRLASLDALYRRFGREGLKDQPLSDVRLLLASKELLARDAARGNGLSEQQIAANRHLELEIKDLTGYVRGQVAGMSLDDLRSSRKQDRTQGSDGQQNWRSNDRDRGRDMER